MLRSTLILAVIAIAAAGSTLATGHTRDDLPQAAETQAPACFGAASHDPLNPCVNPRLRNAVEPSPGRLARLPSAPCAGVHTDNLLTVCTFGVQSQRVTRNVALIGDSHAAHWRAALD